ncbi:unnamed protein product [Gordionus sp. m RMFG-2023]
MQTLILVAFVILTLLLGINTETETRIWITKNSNTCILDLGGMRYTFHPGQQITHPTRCMGCTCQKKGSDSHYSCQGICKAIDITNPKCKLVAKEDLAYPKCCLHLISVQDCGGYFYHVKEYINSCLAMKPTNY